METGSQTAVEAFYPRGGHRRWWLVTVVNEIPVFYDCEASCIGGLPPNSHLVCRVINASKKSSGHSRDESVIGEQG